MNSWGLPASLTGGPGTGTAQSFLLGLLALREGLVDRLQLQKALLKQGELRRFGRHARFGEVLLRMGYVDEATLDHFLAVREALVNHGLARAPLGLRVVLHGMATPSQVLEALDEREHSPLRLGEILVNRGLITPAQLEQLLQEQASEGDGPTGDDAAWVHSYLGA